MVKKTKDLKISISLKVTFKNCITLYISILKETTLKIVKFILKLL